MTRKALTEAQEASYDASGAERRTPHDSDAVERQKRLTAFAGKHPPPGGAFSGDNQSAGLRQWLKDLREEASYCTEALSNAMDRSERKSDEVTAENLLDWGVDDKMDAALRKAIHAWTTPNSTARQFVGNIRGRAPDTKGLEIWRQIIREFDPVNVKTAQQERSALMGLGTASKSWTDFRRKHIHFTNKVLDYENRVASEFWISSPDKCRLTFEMIPPIHKLHHWDLADISDYGEPKAKITPIVARGVGEEAPDGNRSNRVACDTEAPPAPGGEA